MSSQQESNKAPTGKSAVIGIAVGAVVIAAAMIFLGAWGSGAEAQAPAVAKVTPAKSVRTVFIDPGMASKQERAAAKINKTHQKMLAEGYTFVDLEVYTEDGDLQGFFATYER